MKKVLKYVAIAVVGLIAAIVVIGIIKNEKLPVGKEHNKADEMARQMLQAVNKPAWDSTKIVRWTFAGNNTYLWDKERNFVKVSMSKGEVLLNTKTVSGVAYKKGEPITGKKADKLIQKAWSRFCNDSWWLNAPVKAFDEGTERSIVTTKDGRTGLKVQYTSGGVTPGDAYVWLLNDDGLPESYKMWVKIIPVGGVESTWTDWKTLSSGAKIATAHSMIGIDMTSVTNLKDGSTWSDFGMTEDPFLPLLRKS